MNVKIVRPALGLLLLMTCLLGIVYPLLVTAVAGIAFPHEAAGSLLFRDDKAIGSRLIGQHFSDPKYFWGRPSATTPEPYDGIASSGSNLGPLNPALLDRVRADAGALHAADPAATEPIPVDLVTASASGLDPEISVAAARYQIARVARVRGIAASRIEQLVASNEQGKFLGLVGERRVNVLELNVALDQLH